MVKVPARPKKSTAVGEVPGGANAKTTTATPVVTKPNASDEARAAYEGKDYARVRALAEGGNAVAQYNLGEMYQTGLGVPKDCAQAAAWYRKAADQGNIGGQFSIGVMFQNGWGVAKDDAQAVAWFRKAADQGYAVHAGRQVSKRLWGDEGRRPSGRLVPQAADQGYAPAQTWLGYMYRYGLGGAKDDAQGGRLVPQGGRSGLCTSAKST